jgi:hypothetical protein
MAGVELLEPFLVERIRFIVGQTEPAASFSHVPARSPESILSGRRVTACQLADDAHCS